VSEAVSSLRPAQLQSSNLAALFTPRPGALVRTGRAVVVPRPLHNLRPEAHRIWRWKVRALLDSRFLSRCAAEIFNPTTNRK
jgi:hypothetical protein